MTNVCSVTVQGSSVAVSPCVCLHCVMDASLQFEGASPLSSWKESGSMQAPHCAEA